MLLRHLFPLSWSINLGSLSITTWKCVKQISGSWPAYFVRSLTCFTYTLSDMTHIKSRFFFAFYFTRYLSPLPTKLAISKHFPFLPGFTIIHGFQNTAHSTRNLTINHHNTCRNNKTLTGNFFLFIMFSIFVPLQPIIPSSPAEQYRKSILRQHCHWRLISNTAIANKYNHNHNNKMRVYALVTVLFCYVNLIACAPADSSSAVSDQQQQHQQRLIGRSPKYDFGLGKRRYIFRTSEPGSKRIPHYDFGLGKRSV